jgi:hypothetical protein
MKKALFLAVALLFMTPLAHAQLGNTSVNSNLSILVSPEAALTIQTTTTSLTSPLTNFSAYTGTTNFTYFVRTTKSGGTGSVTVAVADFSPAGGPSIVTPPTPTDKLTYSCTVPAASSGSVTPCTGPVTAATSATNVATFGADTRSPFAGVGSSVSWTLTNDPLYQTGSYTAVATFTISAS